MYKERFFFPPEFYYCKKQSIQIGIYLILHVKVNTLIMCEIYYMCKQVNKWNLPKLRELQMRSLWDAELQSDLSVQPGKVIII